MHLREALVYGTLSDRAIVSVAKDATASSAHPDAVTYAPSNANDQEYLRWTEGGSFSTGAGQLNGAWLAYDLGAYYEINGMSVYWAGLANGAFNGIGDMQTQSKSNSLKFPSVLC